MPPSSVSDSFSCVIRCNRRGICPKWRANPESDVVDCLNISFKMDGMDLVAYCIAKVPGTVKLV